MWVTRADGESYMAVGLVRDDVDASAGWGQNKRCWGVYLSSRTMCVAGQYQERSAGPAHFTTPCDVTVLLDSDAGTMSIGVEGQMDLEVVCKDLPKNIPMRFGCSSNNCRCILSMVSYESV